MTRARLFLVDDHDVVRAGARQILGDHFEIVGEADGVAAAIDLIREREPEIVLLDVRLPGGGGSAVVEAVRRSHPDIKFLVFTVSISQADVAQMLELGVSGYVTKTAFGMDLPDLVNRALKGKRPISPDVAGFLLDINEAIDSKSGIQQLTERERMVTTLIARGYTYPEVGNRLGITRKTVESHMSNIFVKLGVASRHELSAMAYEAGFLRPDDI